VPKTDFISKVLKRREKIDWGFMEDYLVELARERDALQELFNSMAEGVLALLHDGRTFFANSAAQRLLGFRIQDALGLNVLRFLKQPELIVLLQDLIENPSRMTETEVMIQVPSPRVLSISALPVKSESEVTGRLLILIEDITDRRARTEEQKRMEKLLSIGHMAAGLAHEIRNPLNSLSLRIQLLKRAFRNAHALNDPRMRDSIQEDLAIIEDEISRLNQVVEQALHASASMPKAMLEIDPAFFLQDLERFVRPECEQAGVTLGIQIETEPTVRVLGDRNALRQVFLNLVKNALEAMPDGGHLVLCCQRVRDQICFCVRDTGRGMSPEEQESIFEPYYTTRAKGTGLGLVIVQRSVQNHGGSIEVESALGKGTEIRLYFPIYLGPPRMIEMRQESDGT